MTQKRDRTPSLIERSPVGHHDMSIKNDENEEEETEVQPGVVLIRQNRMTFPKKGCSVRKMWFNSIMERF